MSAVGAREAPKEEITGIGAAAQGVFQARNTGYARISSPADRAVRPPQFY